MDPLLSFLLDPNIIYLILVVAFSLALISIFSPGTGVIEVAAGFLFILAGYGAYANERPINLWAVIVLVLGVVPFILAVRFSRKRVYLAAAILALVGGSAYLFQGEGWLPGVNPILALVASVGVGGFFWLAATKALEADQMAPSHQLDRLIGAIGEAKTEIAASGSVQVAGELWSAASDQPIPSGARVVVLSREGFILKVEPVSK